MLKDIFLYILVMLNIFIFNILFKSDTFARVTFIGPIKKNNKQTYSASYGIEKAI